MNPSGNRFGSIFGLILGPKTASKSAQEPSRSPGKFSRPPKVLQDSSKPPRNPPGIPPGPPRDPSRTPSGTPPDPQMKDFEADSGPQLHRNPLPSETPKTPAKQLHIPGPAECAKRLNPPAPSASSRRWHGAYETSIQICRSQPPLHPPTRPRAFRRGRQDGFQVALGTLQIASKTRLNTRSK